MNEAFELRDEDPERHLSKGVLKAVWNVENVIAPKLEGQRLTDQYQLDKLLYEQLDGSQTEFGWNKAKLGGNTILAVSMSIARAIAADK